VLQTPSSDARKAKVIAVNNSAIRLAVKRVARWIVTVMARGVIMQKIKLLYCEISYLAVLHSDPESYYFRDAGSSLLIREAKAFP
jgi:hypothetical protein